MCVLSKHLRTSRLEWYAKQVLTTDFRFIQVRMFSFMATEASRLVHIPGRRACFSPETWSGLGCPRGQRTIRWHQRQSTWG